jgi:hypothetical protein
MDIQLGGIIYLLFISMLEPSTWRIVKSGEDGREALRSRKGGYACSCNHTHIPRGCKGIYQ